MTKRNSNFENGSNKKPKLDADIEALWGEEDIDDSDLENCFNLATQGFEERATNNVSLNVSRIPTYNTAFQGPQKLFCSTQIQEVTFIQPGTSKNAPKSNKKNIDEDLGTEIEDLRVKYQEKEGEVSILRSQLKESKSHFNVEQQKIQSEWKRKIVTSEKQIQSVKSELEFKILEIANLKQKLKEVSKRNLNVSLDLTINNIKKGQKPSSNQLEECVKKEASKLYSTPESIYPITGISANDIFCFPKTEKYVIETKRIQCCRNAIPYLQNQNISTRILVGKNNINYEQIWAVILKLLKCTNTNLNTDENITNIKKVIYVMLELLDSLYDLLIEIKKNLRTEDILQIDTIYIKSQYKSIAPQSYEMDTMGMTAGTILNFLSELVLYSSYLINFFCENQIIKFSKNGTRNENSRLRSVSGHQFLNKILDIVKIIGEIRQAGVMSLFLCSSVKLFENISKSGNFDHMSDIYCHFVKEVIFSRPQLLVIFQITSIFKEISVYSSFIKFLVNKGKNGASKKNEVIYFNNDACRFYIFVLMFDKCLSKLENLSFEVCLNMLCFIYNSYKTSHRIHHEDVKKCECLTYLVKLGIEIVYKALQKYRDLKRTRVKSNEWSYFFKSKIVVNILSLMTFHSYELTEKHITVFSQYKEILKLLLEDEDLVDLEKLNITEEIPEIPSTKFDSINF